MEAGTLAFKVGNIYPGAVFSGLKLMLFHFSLLADEVFVVLLLLLK